MAERERCDVRSITSERAAAPPPSDDSEAGWAPWAGRSSAILPDPDPSNQIPNGRASGDTVGRHRNLPTKSGPFFGPCGRTQSRTLTSTVSHAVCATHFFARPNNCVNARKNVVTVRLLLFLTILIVDPHSLRTRAAAYCQCPPGRPRLKSVRASSLQ